MLPNVVICPLALISLNITLSVVSNPKSIVEPFTPFEVKTAVPWVPEDKIEEEITVDPASSVVCVIVPPKLVSTPAIVIPSFTNSIFVTPPSFIVTSPLVTRKLSVLNVAIPLFVEDASSPLITPLEISIPSPAVKDPEISSAIWAELLKAPLKIPTKLFAIIVPLELISPDAVIFLISKSPLELKLPEEFITEAEIIPLTTKDPVIEVSSVNDIGLKPPIVCDNNLPNEPVDS